MTSIVWIFSPGHAGVLGNEQADRLAGSARWFADARQGRRGQNFVGAQDQFGGADGLSRFGEIEAARGDQGIWTILDAQRKGKTDI